LITIKIYLLAYKVCNCYIIDKDQTKDIMFDIQIKKRREIEIDKKSIYIYIVDDGTHMIR
jgi:hypothetical protein